MSNLTADEPKPHNPYQLGRQFFREGKAIQDLPSMRIVSLDNDLRGWLDELADTVRRIERDRNFVDAYSRTRLDQGHDE